MQATAPQSTANQLGRNFSYFLATPLIAFVVATLVLAFIVTTYQNQHNDRIYTGISIWGVDLSQMKPEEAQQALAATVPYPQEEAIVFTDGTTQWAKSPAELGLSFDVETTVDNAYQIGRSGSAIERFRAMFNSWYYGRSLAPIIIFDEGQLNTTLSEIANTINQPATNASLFYDGQTIQYTPGEIGRQLDVADARSRLINPMTDFRTIHIELLVHDIVPAVYDTAVTANNIQQIVNGSITFYLQEPLENSDLERIVLPEEELIRWLRIELNEDAEGVQHHTIALDEDAVRHWLSQYREQLYREPVNARFYFDDDTRELVLVAPHVNGRELDIEATIANLMDQINTPNRSVPLVMQSIVPTVHSGATATELGITELITETTTWFYGSTDARKHNIARAAANFFGIVVAPGEEFSFNRYLGTITEDDGYEEGLIIVGGRTIKGIGGGVCQVSTTVYQTAFLAGFPIVERWEHGYMLGYYNDGQGPGMDATVFSPIVDFRFVNNTPHHLLIENYYNEEFEALTFKFYSTSLGRQIIKHEPVWENVVPAPTEDIWEFDPDLEPGTVVQIDWATEGADVSIQRTVLNADGDLLIDEVMTSNYIPYPNVYHYGPGVEPYDYSLVPDS